MALYPVDNIHENHNEEVRTCWICFGTDDDNPTLPWVQPCSCRGSGQWVHQMCLLLWVDEKKKENSTAKIACPQCKVAYIIIFPKHNGLMSLLSVIDDLVYRACPIIAAGVTVGIIFWAASSYGAFTIMQIFGEEEGLCMLERTDPLALLLFLPIIPTALIVMKMVRWEDYLLNLMRKGSKYPILRHILPTLAYNEVLGHREDILPQPTEISSTRIFVGGLVLPTIAKIFGEVFFHTEQSCLKRFLLGGLSFIAIKGALMMYYKQKSYIQQSQRRVLNHHERISASIRPGTTQSGRQDGSSHCNACVQCNDSSSQSNASVQCDTQLQNPSTEQSPVSYSTPVQGSSTLAFSSQGDSPQISPIHDLHRVSEHESDNDC